MKRLFISSLATLLLSSCQAPAQYLVPAKTQSYFGVMNRAAQAPHHQAMVTAKDAFTQAELIAQQWSQDAALTHVLGQHITSQGLPHAAYGSWTFSFINYAQPAQGFQIVFKAGQAAQSRAVSADQLLFSQPLEDRAWEIDSDLLIPRLRELIPTLTLPLKSVELTAINRRLVWSLGQKYQLDAMTGQPFSIQSTH